MFRDTLRLLEFFTAAYPPPAGHQHALTLPTDECPEDAELVLMLWLPEGMKIHLEASDLERSPEALFLEVRQHLLRMGIEDTSVDPPEPLDSLTGDLPFNEGPEEGEERS